MLKYGLSFLFCSFTHMIIIIMWAQHVFLFKMTHGGVGGNVLSNIEPSFWPIIILECTISICLITYGVYENFKKKQGGKFNHET